MALLVAQFTCASIVHRDGAEDVRFFAAPAAGRPLHGKDPWGAQGGAVGGIELTITNPAALGRLKLGRDYEVEITALARR